MTRDQRAAAFIADLIALYRKHGIAVGHSGDETNIETLCEPIHVDDLLHASNHLPDDEPELTR